MLTPKALEAWYTLMAEAMRGTATAQEALRFLVEKSGSPEELNRWLAQFRPATTPVTNLSPDALEAQLEEWWRLMGVVPRTRYLELLEKCDSLQRRLDKAEATIIELRQRLGLQGQQEEETQKAIDMWGAMMSETLKTQTEWLRAWSAATQSPLKEQDNV